MARVDVTIPTEILDRFPAGWLLAAWTDDTVPDFVYFRAEIPGEPGNPRRLVTAVGCDRNDNGGIVVFPGGETLGLYESAGLALVHITSDQSWMGESRMVSERIKPGPRQRGVTLATAQPDDFYGRRRDG